MTISDQILDRLRCPVTGSSLSRACDTTVRRVNEQIAFGKLLTRMSDVVATPIAAGLVNADRSLLYRIEAGIVVLLPSDAIEIWELNDSA